MCIATWICPSSGPYSFIYASNRDEIVSRPTQRLGPLPDPTGKAPEFLAGKDMLGGGTWLGVRKDGRFAALTNFRQEEAPQEPEHPAPGSTRGTLILDALSSLSISVEETCQRIADEGDTFSGFSLVLGDISHLPSPTITSTSNHGPNRQHPVRADEPDRPYVLSNTSLDHDDHWPK
ncbi:NRDE protein-domain-containing protein, partial [Piptocephalis cylindrospora]